MNMIGFVSNSDTSSNANHVHLSPASQTVWLQGACDQFTAGHYYICHQPAQAPHWAGHSSCEERRIRHLAPWLPSQKICGFTCSPVAETPQQVLQQHWYWPCCSESTTNWWGSDWTWATDDEVEKPADDQEPHDIATFVPAAARKMTEQEVVRKSIVDDRRPTTVPWPSKGDVPSPHCYPLVLVTL